MFNKFIRLLTIFLVIFTAFESYAYNVTITGKATVSKNKLRDAYYAALNNALYGSIRWYYKENNQDVKVTSEYLKFIKSYTILEQKLEENVVVIKVKIDLDDVALQDARLLLNQYSDSAVFIYRGIQENILPDKQVKNAITTALSSTQFATSNEAAFLGKIKDISDNAQIEKAFKDIDSNVLLIFDFQPVATTEEFKDSNNTCEIITTVSIKDKKSKAKTIQITTGSNNTNTAYCYNDAVKQAATETITYVRENIVKLPETAAKLQKYEIKLVNANNFVITKNIMDTLLKRGLIKSSKTVSYNQKSVVFEVESYFSPEELGNKVQSSKLPMKPTKMEFGKKELVLDFAAE